MLGLLAGGALTLSAQTPRIVVGIVVDQLRTDYLEQLRPYFGDKGFSRLINEGAYFTDVDFKATAADSPTGAAVIYTGAWPSANGVAGAEVLDEVSKRNVPVLADASKTKFEYSPANLRLSTIADEFFINNGNLSRIYSISGDPQTAVVAAGHAGTSAIWLDESTGLWNAPTYYGAMPAVVANKNRTSPPAKKIASTVWRPLNLSSAYKMGNSWNDGNFTYGFSGANRDAYSKFKQSAPFNTEVTDIAIDLLKSLQAGGENQTGMLNIEYTAAPINYDFDSDNRPELVDTYVRLDAELGRLLEAIDRDFGKDALVFLTSNGYAQEPAVSESDARIPTGEITLKKVESLLNSFLSAKHGNGDYVAMINGPQLFFDRKLAEVKNLDLRKLRQDAKDFLLKMGGISEVYTIDEVLGADSRKLRDMALGVDPKRNSDLFLVYTPGWTLTDDNTYPPVSKKVRLANPATPAFIMGEGITPRVITESVEATVLAPTISAAIHIRAPNGAASKPISLKH